MPDDARLTLLSRPGCHLCEELLHELQTARARLRLPALQVMDVDSDATLARRYGLRIPVLLLDGELVCETRLDLPELQRLLRSPAPAAGRG